MSKHLLAKAIADVGAGVERQLDLLLPSSAAAAEARLHEAMRYATLGGGKRLRALLAHTTSVMLGGSPAAGLRIGAAIELIHAYSLIHDDLPAMDDALMRRGQPACHNAFDDATAILAGDALQALAFEALARADWPASAEARLALVRGLARAAGPTGMCAGQQIDLMAEGQTLDLDAIVRLQQLKTGALFAFACGSGAILADADAQTRAALEDYAAALGLAFQIKDDLLDLTGDAMLVGKDIGRDEGRQKATFPALLGVEGAQARLHGLLDEGCVALDRLNCDVMLLRELLAYVINREF